MILGSIEPPYLSINNILASSPSLINPVEASDQLAVALLPDSALATGGVGCDGPVLRYVEVWWREHVLCAG